MTKQELLEKLQDETNNDNLAMIAALEDGNALAKLGVTDADQDVVEELHAQCEDGYCTADYGWYEISAEDYHSLNLISSHRLSLLKRSPAHLRHELDNPSESTPAMVQGALAHEATLQPDLFAEKYLVQVQGDGRKKEVKEARAAQAKEAEETGKQIISSDYHAFATSIAHAVWGDEHANALIESAEHIERAGIAEIDGWPCKGLLDALCPALSTAFDLKTTVDASRREFERSIFKFGYHRQGALYVDICRELGVPVEHYAIIAVEKSAPHCVAVYRLKDDILELGRKENRKLIELYQRCLKKDEWPGYPSGVQDVGIPRWAEKQIREDVEL